MCVQAGDPTKLEKLHKICQSDWSKIPANSYKKPMQVKSNIMTQFI